MKFGKSKIYAEIAEAIDQLKDLQESDDIESAHAEADDILCTVLEVLGCTKLVEEYKKVQKWYA